MSRHLSVLIPTTLALAMSIASVAFAGSNNSADAYEKGLYAQPDPFAAVQTSAEAAGWAEVNDARVRKDLQQASTAASSTFDWTSPLPAGREDVGRGVIHEPE